jgi:hypothetical protein
MDFVVTILGEGWRCRKKTQVIHPEGPKEGIKEKCTLWNSILTVLFKDSEVKCIFWQMK